MDDQLTLSRRDALVALAASSAGVAAAGEVAERVRDADAPSGRLDRVLDGLADAAAVVYPSEVTVDESFLRTFVLGRYADESRYLSACDRALRELDRLGRDRFGRSFTDLSPDDRERLMLEAGVADVTADPDGTRLERVRYYVVNQLLFALYSSPTGGELLGVENPPGYPGGLEAYRRGPDDG